MGLTRKAKVKQCLRLHWVRAGNDSHTHFYGNLKCYCHFEKFCKKERKKERKHTPTIRPRIVDILKTDEKQNPGMMVQNCFPSTWEVEAGRSVRSWPSSRTYQDQCQPGLYETFHLKTKTKRIKPHTYLSRQRHVWGYLLMFYL